MITIRHDSRGQISNTSAFIRDRVEQLDQSGFLWTKDSVVEMLCQLVITESHHQSDGAEVVNKTVDTASVLDTSTAITTLDVHENSLALEKGQSTGSVALSEMPVEILLIIISHLEHIAEEEWGDMRERRSKRLIRFQASQAEPLQYTCLHHDEPILNSFQSFAVVCRSIYQLCRPELWKVRVLV